jgi:hypothetical protein
MSCELFMKLTPLSKVLTVISGFNLKAEAQKSM